jgi:hypothetical protein
MFVFHVFRGSLPFFVFVGFLWKLAKDKDLGFVFVESFDLVRSHWLWLIDVIRSNSRFRRLLFGFFLIPILSEVFLVLLLLVVYVGRILFSRCVDIFLVLLRCP